MSDATQHPEEEWIGSRNLFREELEGEGFQRVRRPTVRSGRAFSPMPVPGNREIAQLVEQDGVLRWDFGQKRFNTIRRGRRARGRAGLVPSRVVDQFEFQMIEGSAIGNKLRDLDVKLTPDLQAGAGGLRQLHKNGKFGPPPTPAEAKGKRAFLLIHGTFSNSNNVINALKRTENAAGKALLKSLFAETGNGPSNYDYVLTFDHPTLSVSPFLNAFDLAAGLPGNWKKLDIVCHSRGGLVSRWFCEAICPQQIKRNVVMVGSPLGGTSLAAAPKLRSVCDFLSNLVGKLETVVGWFASAVTKVVGLLLKLVRWAFSALAKTPLFDAAVACVPGLDGQSRIGNNEEIRRLRRNTGNFHSANLKYHAITADFEPPSEGWRFWRYFTHKPGQRLLNAGADVIFRNEDLGSPTACQNDLVVNTDSMIELADDRSIQSVHAFGTQSEVHHCNYFQHPQTIDFIRKCLHIA